jgi:GT2 family glycosyltransferase
MKSHPNTELVTVVMTNYNRCDDLRAAIKSVKEQHYPNMEIIVVDNASQDHSRTMLANEFPEVSVIALAENIGMDGYSLGFQQAKGEFIFQMDNDSLMPDANVLSEIVRRFGQGPPKLAVVATRVEEYRSGLDSIEELRRREKRLGPINTGGFHGGGVGFRRTLLDRVGYYNCDVFLYGSELFLQMKFLAAGYKVLYFPEILVLHKSSNVARSSRGIYYEVRNRYWFIRCFGSTWQKTRIIPKMLFRDFIYAIYKRDPKTVIRAVFDGLRTLPASLESPVCSTQPDFVAKIEEVGAQFGLFSLFRTIIGKIGED